MELIRIILRSSERLSMHRIESKPGGASHVTMATSGFAPLLELLLTKLAEEKDLPRTHLVGLLELVPFCLHVVPSPNRFVKSCKCELCEDYGFLSFAELAEEKSVKKAKKATGFCIHVVASRSQQKAICNAPCPPGSIVCIAHQKYRH